MAKFKVGDTVKVIPEIVPEWHNRRDDITQRECKILFQYTNSDGADCSVVDFGGFQVAVANSDLLFVRKGLSVLTEDDMREQQASERVSHPAYYQHPSGVECITVARHHNFDIGNALKYLWRAGLKQEEGLSSKEKEIEDLQKAVWYVNDWINELKGL